MVLLCWSTAHSQYLPNQAQRFQLMSFFNPAFTGVEDFGDLKLSYRYQWTGFGTNAPKFVNLSYNTRLVQPLDLSYNALRPSSATLLSEDQIPAARRMIHGLGVQLFHSQVGIIKEAGASVNYALHYPLSGKSRLAGGIALVFENRKLDASEVTVRDPDPYYDHLLTVSTSQNDLNVRVGALVYGPRYYIGVTYLPIVYDVLSGSEVNITEAFYRASLQTGVTFPLNADVTLKPSILAILRMDDEVAIDYSVKASFRQNIWLGITYRDIESGVAMVGWNFDHRLSAAYAYEMSLGPFRQFNDGSHELVLALRVNNFKRNQQYTW